MEKRNIQKKKRLVQKKDHSRFIEIKGDLSNSFIHSLNTGGGPNNAWYHTRSWRWTSVKAKQNKQKNNKTGKSLYPNRAYNLIKKLNISCFGC